MIFKSLNFFLDYYREIIIILLCYFLKIPLHFILLTSYFKFSLGFSASPARILFSSLWASVSFFDYKPSVFQQGFPADCGTSHTVINVGTIDGARATIVHESRTTTLVTLDGPWSRKAAIIIRILCTCLFTFVKTARYRSGYNRRFLNCVTRGALSRVKLWGFASSRSW